MRKIVSIVVMFDCPKVQLFIAKVQLFIAKVQLFIAKVQLFIRFMPLNVNTYANDVKVRSRS